MKTKQQIQEKLDELIEFAHASSPTDLADLGRMLMSSGGALMCQAGAPLKALNDAIGVGFSAAQQRMRSS